MTAGPGLSTTTAKAIGTNSRPYESTYASVRIQLRYGPGPVHMGTVVVIIIIIVIIISGC